MTGLCETVHNTLLDFPDGRCWRDLIPRLPAPRATPFKLPPFMENSNTNKLRSPYDEGGGGQLGLCTESLGAESSCDGSIGGEEEEEIRRLMMDGDDEEEEEVVSVANRVKKDEEGVAKEFPPPLLSLMQGGGNGLRPARSCTFMKAVRKDGRLLLTEVKIERPEILRASREDGRLRLQLLRWQEKEEDQEEEEEEEEVEEQNTVVETEEEVEAEEEEEKVGVEAEEEKVVVARPWKWLGKEGEGGGYRRCQEMGSGGRSSHHLMFWNNPRFVTTT